MAKVQIIPPDSYPQMVSKSEAAKISRALHSPDALARGARVIEEASQTLRDGVRHYVRALEETIGDHALTSEKAHEIRGFAETAGLAATGRIADGLCRYFDEMDKLAADPDLEVDCASRFSHCAGGLCRRRGYPHGRHGGQELDTLVDHKLAETKALMAG